MKNLLTGLLIGCVVGSALTFALSRRYLLVSSENTAFRIDTFTGKTWWVVQARWKLMPEAE